MCLFKVGNFIQHKIRSGVKMVVCRIWEKNKYSIGCRWYNEKLGKFKFWYFRIEELELWKEVGK